MSNVSVDQVELSAVKEVMARIFDDATVTTQSRAVWLLVQSVMALQKASPGGFLHWQLPHPENTLGGIGWQELMRQMEGKYPLPYPFLTD